MTCLKHNRQQIIEPEHFVCCMYQSKPRPRLVRLVGDSKLATVDKVLTACRIKYMVKCGFEWSKRKVLYQSLIVHGEWKKMKEWNFFGSLLLSSCFLLYWYFQVFVILTNKRIGRDLKHIQQSVSLLFCKIILVVWLLYNRLNKSLCTDDFSCEDHVKKNNCKHKCCI